MISRSDSLCLMMFISLSLFIFPAIQLRDSV